MGSTTTCLLYSKCAVSDDHCQALHITVTCKCISDSLWQPDDLAHSCEALEPLLNVCLAEPRIAVGVQQALLSGQQRPAGNKTTAVDRPCSATTAQHSTAYCRACSMSAGQLVMCNTSSCLPSDSLTPATHCTGHQPNLCMNSPLAINMN